MDTSLHSHSTRNIRINSERLWMRLMEMARIGATENGGCNRMALTDLDRQGRDLFIKWCQDAGCVTETDAIGNLFVRRQGLNDALPPVVTGSHLDTQPNGGKFDGVLGVLGGLEVIETLNDFQVETQNSLEIIVWTNEEGARFTPAMMGSGVFSGAFDLNKTLDIEDKSGITVRQALESFGTTGSGKMERRAIKAAFELHIEQGPILELKGKQIGVVTGIQGIRWYDITITGIAAHAGPTPMDIRRDPFRGLSRIVDLLYAQSAARGPWARVTFGDIQALPGSRNTVPESLVLSVDLRHPDPAILEDMDRTLRAIVDDVARDQALRIDIRNEWNFPPAIFDQNCIAAVQDAVDGLGYSSMAIVSGAGHDSGYVSRVAPTAMIFVPCEDGVSHNEAENATREDVEAGCNVLLQSMLSIAGVGDLS